ncbi:Zinc finger and SCAN domain-containing protein 5C [Orchesella cincta]|uniref:Zinc finger and SCAN domain-containing protein 5C n=1 Tax=Orchesella cincta TaxID=48709 RepID=A0A1D2M4I5_ORCCI|nr:Zinc finger and SCAN domain-containing protein 5C [Orchesella cincta]
MHAVYSFRISIFVISHGSQDKLKTSTIIMGDASRQNLIPPAGPSMAPTDEEEANSALSKALKAKVDELQKALDSANAKESKRKAEMEETKKWVVEELKLLLLNEDSKNGIELLKEKLKNAEVVMDNGFWKRAEYRRTEVKISVLETTLEETESGLRKELQVKHDEVQGLQRRLELAQQKTRDYLRQVLLEMEGNANLDSEVLVAEGENLGRILGRENGIWEWGVLIIWVVAIVTKSTAVSLPVGVQDRSSTDGSRTPKALGSDDGDPQHLIRKMKKERSSGTSGASRQPHPPITPAPRGVRTRKRNILDRSKNPAEFYQHGEMRRSKMSYDHVNILGENPPLYQCKVCQKKFTGKTTIYYHKYCQSEDADKPFQCGQCRKGFVHRHGFEYHLGTHTAERPFVCVVCKRGFIRKSDLQRHIKTHRHHNYASVKLMKPLDHEKCTYGF